MKKSDFLFIAFIAAIFLPFIFIDSLYSSYMKFNSDHGMVMAFIKFAILSTSGELLGLRISTGKYFSKGFGVAPRAIVWGILGICINAAMIVFSSGVPALLGYLGMENIQAVQNGGMSAGKVITAFCISVFMNCTFGPVFMTFHKITDTHILGCGGSLKALITPIRMGYIMKNLNWEVQWNFVFKKTIPFFWFPAHTVTFLLPDNMRALFAALLGVVLGVLLAVAARMKSR